MVCPINDNSLRQRKALRLAGYDYHAEAYYYITLCAQGRSCFFGEISNGKVLLNEAGKMVQKVLINVPVRFQNVNLDCFVVMPNHIHAIVVISGTAQGPSPTSLSDIIKDLKTYTTWLYIANIHQKKWPAFEKKLWQRGFYEHIIRDEDSLKRIKNYIVENPLKWELDQENPKNK